MTSPAAIQAARGSQPIRRRGAVACRRCRRLRSKCLHQSRTPPCDACRLAGPQVASECHFPRRGEQDTDRQFRRRQIPPPAESAHQSSSSSSQANPSSGTALSPAHRAYVSQEPRTDPQTTVLMPAAAVHIGDALPPVAEIVEGCRVFITSYFQLGFLPKSMFLEELVKNFASIDKFLLTCILSISARFTPVLVRRYGDPQGATQHFLDAAKAVVPTEMYKPSLERIQAFFLLAICQWGNGERDHSSMDMGIAVRMAALLKLHCEESYESDPDTPAEQVVRSESARRVFWMIQSQENLHSGYRTPAPFPLEDITTLLPCSEGDFAFGLKPAVRAALAGTPPAIADPQLVHSPTRCLFASLIQAHGLWGMVARRSGGTGFSVNNPPPWHPDSDHQRTLKELRDWEENIVPRHTFSTWNLRGWKSESLHLAYLSISMVLRLSNIVARRICLKYATPVDQSTPGGVNWPTTDKNHSTESHRVHGASPTDPPGGFWQKMADELFENVWELYEQIEAFFKMRGPDEGFPQILVFCVYTCGSLAAYLWRHPELCPSLADKAETMAQRTLGILSELHGAWPTSSRWQKGLQQAATPIASASPEYTRAFAMDADRNGQQESPQHVAAAGTSPDTSNTTEAPHHGVCESAGQGSAVMDGFSVREEVQPFSSTAHDLHQLGNGLLGGMLPNDISDPDINSILQGDFHFDILGSWGVPPYLA